MQQASPLHADAESVRRPAEICSGFLTNRQQLRQAAQPNPASCSPASICTSCCNDQAGPTLSCMTLVIRSLYADAVCCSVPVLACCCFSLRAPAYIQLLLAPVEHDGKPFFEKLVTFLSSGAVVATVWEGPEVIAALYMSSVHLRAWRPTNGT